jgi:lambda family phage tail tape measure protein
MIGLDDEMYAKQADIARQIEKLKVDRANLAKGQEDESKILSGQISILQNQSKEVEALYGRHKEGIKDQVVLLQSARLVEKARLQDIQNTTDAINAQISRQQALGDILRGANQQAVEATDRPSASQSVGLSSIQKQILDIQESARKAAIEAARSFAANFEDGGDGLTPERARELAAGLDQIAGAYKRVADSQIKVAENNYETARSFSTGWKEAFAKYAEDAQDASKQAQTYFERFTQGFEDAIVSLVTKGKFSFKDFANSIIADFARIEARKMMTSFMGAGGSGGGSVLGSLFNFGKSLFGFANGGLMQAGQPGVVGERGPELFIPTSAGKVVSNAASFGRQEPTIINNAVTYEIQAVDAASFRSLIARDPNFIYAVTEQGRRNQPTRRSA